MNARHRVASTSAALLLTALVACGSDVPQSLCGTSAPLSSGKGEPTLSALSFTASASTPKPQPTLLPISQAEAAADLHNMGLDFSHPIHQYPFCEMPGWGGKPTIQQVFKWWPNLASAAIMTVTGPDGPPRWNTPDGHRWTQAEAIAARMQGTVPTILTPWRLVRSGPDLLGSVPQSVVVWRSGGVVGNDRITGGDCIQGADPAPGQSYLLMFGGPQLIPGSYRDILAAWPYHPATHILNGPWGSMDLGPPATKPTNSCTK